MLRRIKIIGAYILRFISLKWGQKVLATFFTPQKPFVMSGQGSSYQLVDFIVAGGARYVLIVCDPFFKKSPDLQNIINHIERKGCSVFIFSDIEPNPTTAIVQSALKVSLENKCDTILALGGGSAIDVAKVVAAASTTTLKIKHLSGLLKIKHPPLPFYCLPTTAGTGSEATNVSVISDENTHKKYFFIDPKFLPLGVAFDTNLLKTLPPSITAAVGMDALTHAIESYLSTSAGDAQRRYAQQAIKILFEYLPVAYRNGHDENAREMTAFASFLAGYAFGTSSVGYVHAISHQISGYYNTPHGLTNAVLLPLVLRFNKTVSAYRIAHLETLLANDDMPNNKTLHDHSTTNDVLVEHFITRVDELADAIGIPKTIDTLQERDFLNIANDAIAETRTSYSIPKKISRYHIVKILKTIKDNQRNIDFS